jgi:predicted dehydrogenase
LVEVVYIPLPNAQHLEWAVRALEAGKHVLCEKPMGLRSTEVEAMADAARRTGLLLTEGFMYRSHPRSVRVKDLLATGAIGTVHLVRASYAYRLAAASDVLRSSVEADIRTSKDAGGGALLDVGAYCINAIRWYMGKEPSRVSGWSYGAEAGVDMRFGGQLDFGDGTVGSFYCSMDTFGGGQVEIFGTDGLIVIPSAFRLRASSSAPAITISTPDGTRTEDFPYLDQYELEVLAFTDAIGHRRETLVSLDDSLANARALDALRESVSTSAEGGRQSWINLRY